MRMYMSVVLESLSLVWASLAGLSAVVDDSSTDEEDISLVEEDISVEDDDEKSDPAVMGHAWGELNVTVMIVLIHSNPTNSETNTKKIKIFKKQNRNK